MPYIASTMATDVQYNKYKDMGKEFRGIPIKTGHVHIKGGAGVANKKHAMATGLLTPEGVVTKVSDEDLAFLESNPVFKQHKAAGHIRIMKFDTAPAKAAADMNKKDPSAPLTIADTQPGGRIPGAKLKLGSVE